MLYLNPEFQRKYGPVTVDKDRLQVILNPQAWGRNIFFDDGIWQVRNDFIAVMMKDLLHAVNIDAMSKEAQKIRHRILTLSNNQINVEFMLPQEIKANIEQEVIKEHKEGPYTVREEVWHVAGNPTTPMGKQVYNDKGDWIGGYEDTKWIREKGLLCEKTEPDHCVCSIGFDPKENKWYGWSHRAAFGYGVGDEITPKDSGWDYINDKRMKSWKLADLRQAKQAATNFAKSVSHVVRAQIPYEVAPSEETMKKWRELEVKEPGPPERGRKEDETGKASWAVQPVTEEMPREDYKFPYSIASALQGLFITDFGKELELVDEGGGKEKIPRYGVWVHDTRKGKPRVAETSNDLNYLKKKYNTDKVVKT